MKITEAIKEAVETHNAEMAGKCADILRNKGFNYNQVFELANKLTGIGEGEWEEMMYEADRNL